MTFPSGSANIAISGPPGTSIGGIVVLPPRPSIFSKWAFKSGANPEIYVMSADGSGQTNLTDNPANDVFAAWSPVP